MFNFRKEYIIKTTKNNGDVQEIRKKIHFFGFGKAPNMDEYMNDNDTATNLCNSIESNPEMTDYMKNIIRQAQNVINNNKTFRNEVESETMPHIQYKKPKYVVKPCRFLQTKLRGKNVSVIIEKDHITILDKNNPKGPVVSKLSLKFDDI